MPNAAILPLLAAILANRAIRGLLVVAVGAASNLAAIVSNGGYMPADPAAMAALGKFDPTVYSLVLLAMVVVAVAATLTPTRRALKVDPAAALRYE